MVVNPVAAAESPCAHPRHPLGYFRLARIDLQGALIECQRSFGHAHHFINDAQLDQGTPVVRLQVQRLLQAPLGLGQGLVVAQRQASRT